MLRTTAMPPLSRQVAHLIVAVGVLLVTCLSACLAGLCREAAASSTIQAREQQPEVTAETLSRLAGLCKDATARKIWVYFTDKGILDPVTYRAMQSEIAASLDEHAAARRLKALGPDLVDYCDLPIYAGYLSQLEQLGAEIVWESRWLNAASVRGSHAVLQSIGALSFVQKLTLVRRGRSARAMASQEPDTQQRTIGERDLFDYGPSRDQLDEIGIVAVHEMGLSGAGVRITMTDTGYWREHPAFERILAEGRLIAQWDFVNDDGETQDEPGDPEGQHNHGTSTWSIVGSFDEGELIGSAYGAEFLLAKTEDTSLEEPIEEDNWVAAMEWADALGTDIISCSLNYIDWYEYPDMDGNTAVITIAADIAVGRGIVVCTGAGNWGTQDWYYIGAPADGDSIIAVGASNPDGTMWDDSSHGPTYDGRIKPEVVARGAMTYGAVVPGGHGGPDPYRYFDGTSMSCPLVAGAAALILEAHSHWPPMVVREALMMTADNAENPDNHRGWGRIDVMGALGYAAGIADMPLVHYSPRLTIAPNPLARAAEILYDLPLQAAREPATLKILSVDGSFVRGFELPVGSHRISWDGRDAERHPVSSGVYLVQLVAGGRETASSVIVVR